MIIHNALFITRGKTPVVFQPIDQPLHALTEAVEGTIKGASPMFILLARDGHANTVAAQVLPNLATTVGLVTHETTRPAFGAPASATFHGAACHQVFESNGLVSLPRRQHQRHQLARTFGPDMDFRTEAALTAAQRFSLRTACACPSRMLVRPDDGTIDIVDIPVELPGGVSALLDRGKKARPDAGLAPTVEAAGDGGPAAIRLGQVAPGSTCADDPQNTIKDTTMSGGWRPRLPPPAARPHRRTQAGRVGGRAPAPGPRSARRRAVHWLSL